MNTPHKHKDVIIAWANGATIQYKVTGSDKWDDCSAMPSFFSNSEYKIKPEREWPVTSLSKDELFAEYAKHPGGMVAPALVLVANAAIKQYIIDSENK